MLHIFRKTETEGVAASLNANFTYLEAMGIDTQALLASSILNLHGEGKQIGCDLSIGAGLWVEVGTSGEDNIYWVSGYMREIESAPFRVALEANTTNYIYIGWDTDNSVPTARVSSEKTVPSPEGEWYAGEATTGSATCTSVNNLGAESINAEDLQNLIQSLLEHIGTIETSLGAVYQSETPPASVDTRLTTLESGGGVGAETVKWGNLQKSAGDSSTIEQQIDADIADHVTTMHNDSTDVGDIKVDVLINRHDVDAANFGRSMLFICREVNPEIFAALRNVAWVVWGISGDGTDAFDFVDWVNSTWTYTPS